MLPLIILMMDLYQLSSNKDGLFINPSRPKISDERLELCRPKPIDYSKFFNSQPIDNNLDIFGIKFETWGEIFERHAGEKKSAQEMHQYDIDGLDNAIKALEEAPTIEKNSRSKNVVSWATVEGYVSSAKFGSGIGKQFAKMAERHSEEIRQAIDEGLHTDPSKRALVKSPIFSLSSKNI